MLKGASAHNEDNADEEDPAHQGRVANGSFEFDDTHPLHATHIQRLRSKHVTPIIAGGPIPSYPASSLLG